MTTYKHFQLTKDQNKVLWLYFDKKDASVNTLNREVLEEFSAIIAEIEAQPEAFSGLVIGSKKKSGFIAGADIDQFTQMQSADEANQLIRKGQLILNHLEALKLPTIAAIEGFCLGGGLELALACQYRIALDDPKTRLGLPEVLLGIHPGWGGSVRLPRLIGAPKALDLILTGRTVSAIQAYKLGFVDAAVPRRQFEHAIQFALSGKLKQRALPWFQRLTNATPIRPILSHFIKKKLEAKVNSAHYPAPFAVLSNWTKEGVQGESPYILEAKSISELIVGNTAKNLVRVFYLQEHLKALTKGIDFQPKHVHVIGAGTMGGDIAAWCALRGMTVTLQDREIKYLSPAMKRANDLFKLKLKTPRAIQEAMDRFIPDVEGRGIGKADVIIEAIYENLEAKQKLFKELEQQAKKEAILATNTSSIPLAEISQVMESPARLVGIHFFNPVAKMPLVEIVSEKSTAKVFVDKALAFVRKVDRYPLPVRSSPGFLVNRVLMPYLLEAVHLLEEGVPATAIDKAAVDFGMPMGPIELSDTVGLDVCLSVAKNLTQHLGGEMPKLLNEMVEKGKLGRKSGEGFYLYKNGHKQKFSGSPPSQSNPNLANRLIFRMLNEAVICLREGVINDPDLLDAGMIFGTGFAPYLGGPIHYIKTQGVQNIISIMHTLNSQYGERFTMDKGWQDFG